MEEVEEIDVEDDSPHSPHILGDDNEIDGIIGGVSSTLLHSCHNYTYITHTLTHAHI